MNDAANDRGTPLMSAHSLVVGYRERPLLAPVDLDIERGQLWCVLGRNGAGKTTLLRTLLGLLPKVSGTLIPAPGLRLAYLPQRARFDELYPMSARDVVTMGTERDHSFLRRRDHGTRQRVEAALEALDLGALDEQRYRDLSEGQKQRVLVARTVAAQPDLAFADEPTSAMDRHAEERSYAYLREQREASGMSLLVVTHDVALTRFADRVLFVDDAEHRVSIGTPREILRSEAFRERYGMPERQGGDHART